MKTPQRVLLFGGTGRTGQRVLAQLLERGVPVRAVVRSASRLPEGVAGTPGLEIVEADVLSLSDDRLRGLLAGCDAVVSRLGHTTTVRGIFGAPHRLVLPVVARVCAAARALRSAEPVRLVLMSTVSVHTDDPCDARRGALERAIVRVLCALVPPAKDNQLSADYLRDEVGPKDPYVRWSAVRPDTLIEGDISRYCVHEGLQASLAKPDTSRMSNVAYFMCELLCDAGTWAAWEGKLPVVIDAK